MGGPHPVTVGTPTALDYWTLSVALLGALTGMAALAVTLRSVVLADPQVKVSVADAYPTAGGDWCLSVDASNVGAPACDDPGHARRGPRRRGGYRANGVPPQLCPCGVPEGDPSVDAPSPSKRVNAALPGRDRDRDNGRHAGRAVHYGF